MSIDNKEEQINIGNTHFLLQFRIYKMKYILAYLALVNIVTSITYHDQRLQFVFDYFENKNTMITANVCWDTSKIFL